MAGVGGEGPEGLKKIYESVNRVIRIEHIMKRGLFGGLGVRSRLERRLSRSRVYGPSPQCGASQICPKLQRAPDKLFPSTAHFKVVGRDLDLVKFIEQRG
jgi:hypothetical protein